MWASVILVCGLNSCGSWAPELSNYAVVSEIFSDQGSDECLLHCQVGPFSLSHQGNPGLFCNGPGLILDKMKEHETYLWYFLFLVLGVPLYIFLPSQCLFSLQVLLCPSCLIATVSFANLVFKSYASVQISLNKEIPQDQKSAKLNGMPLCTWSPGCGEIPGGVLARVFPQIK